mmetsp:Transcript_6581/g.12397  ORF Transcript_6581/g.12397 Transcript_6581/m.12397 type:complete len:232 (+) Transcript_6581:2430-3125(+)
MVVGSLSRELYLRFLVFGGLRSLGFLLELCGHLAEIKFLQVLFEVELLFELSAGLARIVHLEVLARVLVRVARAPCAAAAGLAPGTATGTPAAATSATATAIIPASVIPPVITSVIAPTLESAAAAARPPGHVSVTAIIITAVIIVTAAMVVTVVVAITATVSVISATIAHWPVVSAISAVVTPTITAVTARTTRGWSAVAVSSLATAVVPSSLLLLPHGLLCRHRGGRPA